MLFKRNSHKFNTRMPGIVFLFIDVQRAYAKWNDLIT